MVCQRFILAEPFACQATLDRWQYNADEWFLLPEKHSLAIRLLILVSASLKMRTNHARNRQSVPNFFTAIQLNTAQQELFANSSQLRVQLEIGV